MLVYISIDMEGVAGVVHVDQTRRTGHDYERARRWMTAEANAAIAGAFEGGATDVLVNDSHGDMRNLLLDELDRRAELISGSLKPLSMVQGVTKDAACALFVGYHAGAGSRAGILDHTMSGRVVARLRVAGSDWSETALNAALCGSLGVPVTLVTGDQTACAQARHHLGDDVGTVVVKDAITRYAARMLSPALACEKIRAAAAIAVKHRRTPFTPPLPLELELDFVNSACADAAELVPATRRVGGLTCAYRAPDAATLIQVIQAWTILAGSTLV
ncbi:MAG TPA: M55 family metallopeptidase [Kofleriaceae bacterium]|jgi:D-amino peptidase|nr:M55 family metallopeptidase [Kofleriaceae bacterium]